LTLVDTTQTAVDNKLATDYEAVRRQEYEMITGLLEVLPRIESLPQERVSQVRDALFHADHPYLGVFVGPFSSGKSSIINALLGENDLLRVGPTPTTDRVTILRWGEEADRMSSGGDVDTVFHPSPLLRKVSFVDTPGLESIFTEHDDTTQKFLHRSDTVFMVMLATQAMSAKNLEALIRLKQFGKNIIIMINQADLLSAEEADSVREYVQEQSEAKLGYKPEVWLVSAHQGMEANKGENRNEDLWTTSGLDKLENYITNQLGDAMRMKQKLQTPLQITQNATQTALGVVRENQATFDRYATIVDNVQTQLDSHKRAQRKNVQDANDEISTRFGEASMRGSQAIRDLFSFGRAFSQVGRGTLELFRLGSLVRPRGSTTMRQAFERRKALEPLNKLSDHVDELAGRLEGRDLQDVDDLVSYSQQQVSALPDAMQNKLIGTVQAPKSYDRSALLNVRDELTAIEDEARQIEIENLNEVLRDTVIYLAVYEIIMLVFAGVLVGMLVGDPTGLIAVLLLLVLGLMLLGLAFVPLRGRMIENSYTGRMLTLQNRYLEMLTKAADEQIAQGMKLREDAVMPLTRLIESQTETHADQLKKLQTIQQDMVQIEASLAEMGKRRLLAGLRN
jgi:GTP-binding protein EngB required for normal cell division